MIGDKEIMFKGMTFTVRQSQKDGQWMYQEKELGGPWSSCEKMIVNMAIDIRFRRLLRKAIEEGEKK